jgi:hypothetical protein
MRAIPPHISTSELRIVDPAGNVRLVLASAAEGPSVRLLSSDGVARAALALGSSDQPSLKLLSPDPSQPSAALEVDDKGVHVRFDRPAGGASYVFLNNEGASGVVLIDTNGVRRLEAVLAPNGEPIVRRFDVGGQAMP